MEDKIIYLLYGNDILIGKFKTKQESEKTREEFKQTEQRMVNCNNIKYKIIKKEKKEKKTEVNNYGKK